MGDTLTDLRTRFLQEVSDRGQTQVVTAVMDDLINEGARHAGSIIQECDPKWPQREWKVASKNGVPRYALPDDFAEDYGVYRSDLTGEPRIPRISLSQWNSFRYSKNYVLNGPVNDVGGAGIVNDVVPATVEVYYIERPWIGILPVPSDNIDKYVLQYRSTIRVLTAAGDESVIPDGNGTDVICLYGAVSWLSRRGHDAGQMQGMMGRLQAAEKRLKTQFGQTSASPPIMQDSRVREFYF